MSISALGQSNGGLMASVCLASAGHQVVDGRNCLDPAATHMLGVHYRGRGRAKF